MILFNECETIVKRNAFDWPNIDLPNKLWPISVKASTIPDRSRLKSTLGAVIAVLCGLLLWKMPFAERWVTGSYDYLFRFGAHSFTNQVSLILMDNAAFEEFHQVRGQPWAREWHTRLLNKLADDGCKTVVFDSLFREPRNPEVDMALAAAMKRQHNIVLMAGLARVTYANNIGVQPVLPAREFLAAAQTNWGIAWLDPDLDLIVRRHWPFPSPKLYSSLAWKAAQMSGAELSDNPRERWLRYYGPHGAWTSMSYGFALTRPKDFFRNQIVFIGTEPQTSPLDGEPDEFATPYTRWTGESSGGVEIIATSCLNLLNHDWLQRPAPGIEFLILTITGILLGGISCRINLATAAACSLALGLLITLVAILGSYLSHYWFPWLIIVGGQIPCALVWTVATRYSRALKSPAPRDEKPPKIRGYKFIHPPFGRGAYGQVWLAKNAAGQWRALKVVYLKHFGNNAAPFERELSGISRYQPVSRQHPALLQVDFVSEIEAGYFYYVMELGDAMEPNWEGKPKQYQPRDLANERARFAGYRLPFKECVRIALSLAEALEFLHQHGLTHRDIKPQNVIFVHDQPKLADMGLIAGIRPPDQVQTYVGTPGYLPPPPELPGTPQADIYALGMLLYVISTGRSAAQFPEIATTMDTDQSVSFIQLNDIILTACDADLNRRYSSAAGFARALRALQRP